MKFVKQTIGHLRSAWDWGVLGLVLALAVTLGSGEVAFAATRTINLNTGYDQWSNQKIGVSQQDNEWRVTFDPTSTLPPPSLATGRPADVVNDSGWVLFNPLLPSTYPNSSWISVALNAGLGSSIVTPYEYSFYFTLPPGFSNPQLTMKLNADDHITGVTLNSCTLFAGTGGIFVNVPLSLSSNALNCFKSGPNVNVLTVTVENTVAGTITGLIVDGTVTYDDCDRQPVRQIPGLQSITLFESTFATPTPIPLAANSSDLVGTTALTTQIAGPLGPGPSNDFEGVPGAEFYDVFYSDWNGTFNYNGHFVTIEAVWPIGAPSGGGLNIAAVQLDFSSGQHQLANFVSSFVALGNNAMPNDVGRAVDASTVTDTTMGNTFGQTQRLRVTVGFPCPCARPPSGMVAWWPLDEQAGANVIQDILGFDNNGTTQPGPVGPPAAGPMSVPGQVNGALYFVNNYIDVPPATNLDLASSDLTIDGWFSWGLPGSPSFGGIPNWSPGQTIYDAIVDKLNQSPNPNSGYALFVRTQATPLPPNPVPNVTPVTVTVDLVFALGSNIYTAQIHSGATTFPPPFQSYPPLTPAWPYSGQWLHVAVTVDRNTNIGTFYLNGNPVGTFAPAVGINNTAPLWIGQSRLPVSGFEFDLDELEIFNVALPQSDIQLIYNAGPAGKCRTTDTTLDPFTFTDLTDVPRNTVQASNAVTVSGITAPAAIAVVGGEYEVNSSGTWTSSDGTVADGDTVRVRHTSAATHSTAVHTMLTIGGVSDTFTSTTLGPDLAGTWNPVNQSCLQNKCKLKGSVRVVNQGNATARASRLRVLLSDDAVLDPSDAVLKESKIKKLKPGRGKTSKVKVTLPLGVTASGKYLFAVIDTLNLVAETDETNNTPMTGPIP